MLDDLIAHLTAIMRHLMRIAQLILIEQQPKLPDTGGQKIHRHQVNGPFLPAEHEVLMELLSKLLGHSCETIAVLLVFRQLHPHRIHLTDGAVMGSRVLPRLF